MSRILWLDGLEAANANTYSRYIYIHGTNHEEHVGEPASHGCVRMKNEDIAALFKLVQVGMRIVIAPPRVVRRGTKKARKALRARSDLPK